MSRITLRKYLLLSLEIILRFSTGHVLLTVFLLPLFLIFVYINIDSVLVILLGWSLLIHNNISQAVDRSMSCLHRILLILLLLLGLVRNRCDVLLV